jgi:CHRD domain-containing protein
MRLIVSAFVAASCVLAFGAVYHAPVVEAACVTTEVEATGAEQVPPVTNNPGTATARFAFDDVTRQLSFFVTVTGVGPEMVTSAHLHRGAPGVNGPITHFLSAGGFTEVAGVITFSEADVADLRAGDLYLSVHSQDFPGGFARGQLVLPAAGTDPSAGCVAIEVQMVGAEETPPVTNYPAGGLARFTFEEDTRRLTYFVTLSGISENIVTSAHIHRGARGVNGPIVHFLSNGGFTQVAGEITLSEADVADLRAGNLYVNAHSQDFPGGFARGQLNLSATGPQSSIVAPRAGDAGLLDSDTSVPYLFIALLTMTMFGGAAAVTIRLRR